MYSPEFRSLAKFRLNKSAQAYSQQRISQTVQASSQIDRAIFFCFLASPITLYHFVWMRFTLPMLFDAFLSGCVA
jgi:hypothetical protein